MLNPLFYHQLTLTSRIAKIALERSSLLMSRKKFLVWEESFPCTAQHEWSSLLFIPGTSRLALGSELWANIIQCSETVDENKECLLFRENKASATKSGKIFSKQIFIFVRKIKTESSKTFFARFCVLAFFSCFPAKSLFLPLNKEKSELLNEILL